MFFLKIVMQTRFYTAEEQLNLSMQCWAHPRHAHPAAHTHAVHAHVRQTHAVHAHVRQTHAVRDHALLSNFPVGINRDIPIAPIVS
jgi:hypothetical protein